MAFVKDKLNFIVHIQYYRLISFDIIVQVQVFGVVLVKRIGISRDGTILRKSENQQNKFGNICGFGLNWFMMNFMILCILDHQ